MIETVLAAVDYPLERIIALRDQVNELGGRLDTIVTEGPER